MMTEEMLKQMPHAMGATAAHATHAGHAAGLASVVGHPVAQSAMMAATGYAAGRGLLGGGLFGSTLLRSPLLLLAAGAAAGYLLFKYEKEIILALSKASGMGKDFVLQQKENLDDLMAEAQAKEAQQGAAAASADTPKA
ncbi:MAG: hypothetical protein Q8O25_07835 [Sulfurisoma sp.]|nr:hypothetical protein [Sulfurisoma sp.]